MKTLTNIIWFLLVLAFAFFLGAFAAHQYEKIELSEPQQKTDTLGIIQKILDGDKKECALLQDWPEAAEAMLYAAQQWEIDPYLLPCISRAEGPKPYMLKLHNPYGLEFKGKLIQFSDYYRSTEAACILLKQIEPHYRTADIIEIDSLAAYYCPVSKERWAQNVKAIYQEAVK